MRIRFLGCRGSIQVSGSEYDIFGGNTACIQIIDNDDFLILDAGSGIRNINSTFLSDVKNKDINILLTHFHWDHIIGIPFFKPFYIDKFNITMYGPKNTSEEIFTTINSALQEDYFPINLDKFTANVSFLPFYEDKELNVGNLKIEAIWGNHSCFTLVYKITKEDKRVVYLTDYEPYKKYLHSLHPSLKEYENNIDVLENRLNQFIKGSDILIIDGEYLEDEYESLYKGWGHSSINDSFKLALDSDVKHCIIFHHNQERTDYQLNIIQSRIYKFIKKNNINLKLSLAREKYYLDI